MVSWFRVLLFVVGAMLSPVAHAEEPSPDKLENTLETLDKIVAQGVGVFYQVLFFDLYPFDNTLSAEEVKTLPREDGLKVVSHDPTTDTYKLAKVQTIKAPTLMLQTPRHLEVSGLSMDVKTEMVKGVPTLMAVVPAQALPSAIALPEPTEGEKPGDVVEIKEPFSLRVVRNLRRTVLSTVQLTKDQVPQQPGDTVFLGDGKKGVIAAITKAGAIVHSANIVQNGPIANPNQLALPAVVVWLVLGAVFFTIRMGFVNIRAFPHAIAVTMGRYDHEHDEGEISHFQALSSALSATVGLGNIAGVAVAVSAGGPGAIFWMVCAGILGMSSKFVECTLGQMYRTKLSDGSVSGGPMHYLSDGLEELGLGAIGKGLAYLFAMMCVGGSLGGGNMFQANQSFGALFETMVRHHLVSVDTETTAKVVFGVVLACAVGLVTLGGIQRIGKAASAIVPTMCGLYLLAGGVVLAANAAEIPNALYVIVTSAFAPEAVGGGFLGVLMIGFQRAAFSNEAGVGSASIAHSAATTAYPVREGIVALLEPFIDTVVVCTMTGLVVVVTGAYQTEGAGIILTQTAFGSVVSWFPDVLSVAVVLFAFSTMISWSYYGERCSVFLFGDWARIPYRVVFLLFVVLGSVIKLGSVLDFSDLMILGMAFPNIFGALLLSGKVKSALDDYLEKLRTGVIRPRSA